MKVQYISDIHLEFYEDILNIPIIPSAPILCLLGDIGNPNSLNYDIILNWCSKNYKKVFIITGNHEYYSINFTIEEIDKIIIDKIKKYDNISFLNNTIEKYENFTFVGTTLWSYIPETIKNYELNIYNDFKKIKNMSRKKYNELFEKNLEFLSNSIKKYNNIICLTHHLPSYDLIHEKYKNYPNFMFSTDLNYLMKDNIKAWLCGHSHTANTKIINNVICSLNPFGYPNENNIDENCLNKIITI